MPVSDLKNNVMMSHLLDALSRGEDIGHYGRLTFAMVARHFMSADEVAAHLAKDPQLGETQAKALVMQVNAKDYNPPKPEKIRQWQREQPFPICPDGDGGACNVYKDLRFPEGVYEHINEFYEQKAESA